MKYDPTTLFIILRLKTREINISVIFVFKLTKKEQRIIKCYFAMQKKSLNRSIVIKKVEITISKVIQKSSSFCHEHNLI